VSLRQYYEVRLDQFEGPLDLLLYLVQRDEVDIALISVARITEQYLQYLDMMRELNINVAAEYLHMASTLVRLKAHELLPQSEREEIPEEEGIYSREQLIQQLLEYKKFKEAAFSLRQFESSQIGSFSRGVPEQIETVADNLEQTIGNISVFDLIAAFQRVLEQARPDEPGHVVQVDPKTRLDDRIEHVLGMVIERREVKFEELFADDRRRIVIVVTFMAILELIKMQEIVFRQEQNFSAIFVARRPAETRDPEMAQERPDGIAEPPQEPTQ
jgi:segregation and condensation protein A